MQYFSRQKILSNWILDEDQKYSRLLYFWRRWKNYQYFLRYLDFSCYQWVSNSWNLETTFSREIPITSKITLLITYMSRLITTQKRHFSTCSCSRLYDIVQIGKMNHFFKTFWTFLPCLSNVPWFGSVLLISNSQ